MTARFEGFKWTNAEAVLGTTAPSALGLSAQRSR
jgi:hypothetical protein